MRNKSREACRALLTSRPAIRAIQDMIQAPDFDRQMLILATKVAHDWNMKAVLLTVLSALLDSLHHDELDTTIEAVTLVRWAPLLVPRAITQIRQVYHKTCD